jgi:hypothetical protein
MAALAVALLAGALLAEERPGGELPAEEPPGGELPAEALLAGAGVTAVAQPGLVQALHAQARSRALVPAGPDSRLTARRTGQLTARSAPELPEGLSCAAP